jgi:hypothetical protein
MRTLLALVSIGWLLQQPWMPFVVAGTILLAAGLLAWMGMQHLEVQAAPQTWRRIEPHFDEPQPQDQERSDRLLLDRIEQLETDLEEARREAHTLRGAKERLERDLKNAKAAETRDGPNPLFRRVGLDENVPEWVAVAARRAYRARLHPDRHPENRKQEAEARFKLVEDVFAQIWKLRGFQS